MVENDCKFEREISMDLDRTFPDLDFFKSKHKYSDFKINYIFLLSKRNLQNILRAISNSYPDIGYTQGMNFWVGVLILNGLKENEVYWLLRFFLTKMDLKSMVSPGFPRMCILNYQLEIYLKFQMKDVIDKLVQTNIYLICF